MAERSQDKNQVKVEALHQHPVEVGHVTQLLQGHDGSTQPLLNREDTKKVKLSSQLLFALSNSVI